MEKNRASNRHQRRIASKRRKAIKSFREPLQFSRSFDRMKRALLDQLRTKAWTLAHTD